MANITAAEVKKLRDLTGAGMMDCKNALVEADGNFDEARNTLVDTITEVQKGVQSMFPVSGNSTKSIDQINSVLDEFINDAMDVNWEIEDLEIVVNSIVEWAGERSDFFDIRGLNQY